MSYTIYCQQLPHNADWQGSIWGVCLAVTTDPFAPQVLSIKADKTSNVVTAHL